MYLAATYVVMSSLSFPFDILLLGDTSLYLLFDVSSQIMLRTNGKTTTTLLSLLSTMTNFSEVLTFGRIHPPLCRISMTRVNATVGLIFIPQVAFMHREILAIDIIRGETC
jgi:hypothetical protein